MRYQFDIQLVSMTMKVPYEVTCMVVWKKDQKRLETKTNPSLGNDVATADFKNERLSMISSIYKDKQTG